MDAFDVKTVNAWQERAEKAEAREHEQRLRANRAEAALTEAHRPIEYPGIHPAIRAASQPVDIPASPAEVARGREATQANVHAFAARPTYNHTRADSPVTPCDLCDATFVRQTLGLVLAALGLPQDTTRGKLLATIEAMPRTIERDTGAELRVKLREAFRVTTETVGARTDPDLIRIARDLRRDLDAAQGALAAIRDSADTVLS